jgi:hypothetical protein
VVVLEAVFLYRIAYASPTGAHSVVRSLAEQPVPGDQIVLDAHTVVTVREIIVHTEGGTIAAEVIAETTDDADPSAIPEATGSAFRSSR